jgi:hypothetical protein
MAEIATHVNNKLMGHMTAIYNSSNKGKYHAIIMQKNNVSMNLPIELQHIIFKYIDNEMLIIFYQDHVDVIDMDTGYLINSFNTLVSVFNDYSISPDGSMILIINNLNNYFEIKVFDTLTGDEIKSFNITSENFKFINEFKCSSDNKRIYVVFYKEQNFHLYCFDINTGVLLFSNIFYAGVSKIFLSPNNKLMCIAHDMIRLIEIFNAITGELLYSIDNVNGHVIKFSKDSNHLIIQTYSDDVDEYLSHQNILLDIIKFNFNTLESKINDENNVFKHNHDPMHNLKYSSMITIYPNGYIKKISGGSSRMNGKLSFSESGKYCFLFDSIFIHILTIVHISTLHVGYNEKNIIKY